MFKPITKAQNNKTILVYYALAIIFLSIGLYTGKATWNVVGVFFLGLALFRKYFFDEEVEGMNISNKSLEYLIKFLNSYSSHIIWK